MRDQLNLIFSSIRRAFVGSEYEAAVLFLVVVAFGAWLVWLVLPRRRVPAPVDDGQNQQKDHEFFDLVMNQRGVDGPDRDALVRIAHRFGESPVYSMLLRPAAFDQALERARSAARLDLSPALADDLARLEHLRARLFPGS